MSLISLSGAQGILASDGRVLLTNKPATVKILPAPTLTALDYIYQFCNELKILSKKYEYKTGITTFRDRNSKKVISQ